MLTQTFAVLLATTLVETSRIGGFLSRALLFVLGAGRRGVHARAALAEARVRGRPRRGGRLRPARPRRRARSASTAPAELVAFAASPATEPLYTVDPFEPDRLSRMFRTHPPLAERVRGCGALRSASGRPAAGGAPQPAA